MFVSGFGFIRTLQDHEATKPQRAGWLADRKLLQAIAAKSKPMMAVRAVKKIDSARLRSNWTEEA